MLRKRNFDEVYPELCQKAEELTGERINVDGMIAYAVVKGKFEVFPECRQRLANGNGDRFDYIQLLGNEHAARIQGLTKEQLEAMRPIAKKVAKIFGPIEIESK